MSTLFCVGMRVKLTEQGIDRLGSLRAKIPYDAKLRGTVRGFGRRGYMRVQRDGTVTPEPYSTDFWEPINSGDDIGESNV